MTADLLLEDAPDVEDFIACWMQPVMRTAVERGPDDELPFCTAVRIDGADDPWCGADEPVMQLDFFGLGVLAANAAAKRGHRRMMLLARTQQPVTMSDGSLASPDYVETLMKPRRMPYEHDLIVRYTARYLVGLSYVAVV